MKKLLSVVLALALVLSLGATALAADVGIICSADGPTAILITSDDGMLDGPGMVKDVSAVEQIKAQLPCPDVNIWLNGAFMTFPDAVPQIVDGRTQAPYRAVLEAMGATVGYDAGKIEAVFPDGSRMNLAIGDKVMTYTKGDSVNTVEMDVAPFIQASTGRTFVPVRFIGEALGKTVTWSPELRVAYIVDWDALQQELDAHFTKLNAMMADLTAAQKALGPQRSDGSVKLTMNIAGLEGAPLTATLSGTTLTDNMNMSGSYKLGVDLGGLADLLAAEGGDATALVGALDGSSIDMIFSAENGMYLRTELLTLLLGLPEGAWLSADLNALTEGVDISALLKQADNGSYTIGMVLRAMLADGTLAQTMGYMAPDAAARMIASVLDGMLGNDCIKVTESGVNKTYTLHSDEKALAAAVQAIDAEAAAELTGAMKLAFDMTVTLRRGKLYKMSADMTMTAEGMNMTMHLTGSDTKADGTVTLTMPEMLDLSAVIDLTSSSTEQRPAVKPADGELILAAEELADLLANLIPAEMQ